MTHITDENDNLVEIKDYEQPFTAYFVCCNDTNFTGIMKTAYYDNSNKGWFPNRLGGAYLSETEAIEYCAYFQNQHSKDPDCIFICRADVKLTRVAVKLEAI